MGIISEIFEAGLIDAEALGMLPNENDQGKVDFAIEAGLLNEADFYQFLSKKYSIITCNLDQVILDNVSEIDSSDTRYLVLYKDNSNVKIAINDPGDLLLLDKLSRKFQGLNLQYILIPKSQISRFYKTQNTSSAYIIEKANKILIDAIKRNANDVHFNPGEMRVNVKFRVSGTLENYCVLITGEWERIKRRIKIIADLDTAETRIPQSGHGILVLPDKIVHLRVSTHPGLSGEAITVRIQDFQTQFLELNRLGFEENELRKIRQGISVPNGLFIIAGPTGSGKTTTLYSILNEFKDKNVMTLEDPVELRIDGIKQLDVKEENLISFADGIKSILRHDPDVILIGEIRDSETAKMALRAALTGKLVFTTVHAKNCIGSIERLVELGLDFNDILLNTTFIMSQRLLCLAKNRYKRIPVAEILDLHPLGEFKDIHDMKIKLEHNKELPDIAFDLVTKGIVSKESFVEVFGNYKL